MTTITFNQLRAISTCIDLAFHCNAISLNDSSHLASTMLTSILEEILSDENGTNGYLASMICDKLHTNWDGGGTDWVARQLEDFGIQVEPV